MAEITNEDRIKCRWQNLSVCDLLQNARTCLYGNHIFEFFQLDPSPLEDHFQ